MSRATGEKVCVCLIKSQHQQQHLRVGHRLNGNRNKHMHNLQLHAQLPPGAAASPVVYGESNWAGNVFDWSQEVEVELTRGGEAGDHFYCRHFDCSGP